MNTDLVRTETSLEEVSHRLDELVADGDVETLAEGRAQADAYAAYERRQGAIQRANQFMRIKILAEAAIGLIDVRSREWGHRPVAPLVLGDVQVSSAERIRWATFGVAKMRGLLDQALDAQQDNIRRGINAEVLYEDVRRTGAAYVPRSILVDRWHKRKAEGMTMTELAQRTGLKEGQLQNAFANVKRQPRIRYPNAVPIALALGLDPMMLPTAPPRPSRTRTKGSRMRRERHLRGGKWDRAYVQHRKTMQEVFAITGEAGSPALWEHLHAIEDYLRRRI